MKFAKTIFECEIAGEKYRFAALTMRQMERLSKQEDEATDLNGRVAVRQETIALALSGAGEAVTADDIAENMSGPVFAALFAAVMQAHGLKLETKNLGELAASASS